MRQGQQNRRGRGRNNNNNHNQHRKGQNPLTRSFESTGPDMKIRGTPAHIAEKYMALARDATSAGDPVLAENYLQHAEHYNRIIMAYREQQMSQGGGADMTNGMIARHRPAGFDPTQGDEFGDEETGDEGGGMGAAPAGTGDQPQSFRNEQQPRQHDNPRFDDRGPRGGQDGQPRHFRDRDRDNRDRQGGGERRFQDRQNDRGDRGERFSRHDRGERHDGGDRQSADMGSESGQPRRQDRPERSAVPHHEQPEFLRRPVRRPRREGREEPAAAGSDEPGRD